MLIKIIDILVHLAIVFVLFCAIDYLHTHKENWKVRMKVAAHQNTAPDVLETLSKDKNPDVRRAVALNENTPQAVLETLAKDKDANVRRAVVENKNTSAAVLEVLTDCRE